MADSSGQTLGHIMCPVLRNEESAQWNLQGGWDHAP